MSQLVIVRTFLQPQMCTTCLLGRRNALNLNWFHDQLSKMALDLQIHGFQDQTQVMRKLGEYFGPTPTAYNQQQLDFLKAGFDAGLVCHTYTPQVYCRYSRKAYDIVC